MKREMTYEEWYAEGVRRYGPDPMNFWFVCPVCGYQADARDWLRFGAREYQVGRCCIGRFTEGLPTPYGLGVQPCQYDGGGFWRHDAISMVLDDGECRTMFDFADDVPPEEEEAKA